MDKHGPGETGGSGFEIIIDPDSAGKRIKDLRYELMELMKTLKEDRAIARAQAIEEKIVQFCKENDINCKGRGFIPLILYFSLSRHIRIARLWSSGA